MLFAVAMIFLLALPMVNATDILYGYNDRYNSVVFSCSNFTDAPCSAGASCLLTLRNTDSAGTYILQNVTATNRGNGDFNYTVSRILNSADYPIKTSCLDGGYTGTSEGIYRVTPTGDDRGISWLLILVLGSVIITILAIATKNAYLGTISGLAWSVGGVYTMIFGFENLANIYTQMTGIVVLGIGIYIMFASIGELLDNNGESGGEDYYEDNED